MSKVKQTQQTKKVTMENPKENTAKETPEVTESPKENKVFTCTFEGVPVEAVNIILAGLGKLPREVSDAVYQFIQSTAQAQFDEFTKANKV